MQYWVEMGYGNLFEINVSFHVNASQYFYTTGEGLI